MRTVSQGFIDASISPVGFADAYIMIGSARINAEDIIDITVDTNTGNEGAFSIGTFNTTEVSMTVVSEALPLVVTAQPISIYFGYYVEGETPGFEYVPMGIFYAEPRDVSHKNLFTTISAHDRSWAMNDPYISALDFTGDIKVSDVLAEIQTALSLTMGSYGGLAPSSVRVYKKPEGAYRDVIAQMAMLMGTCAKINRTGALDFIKADPSRTPVQEYGPYDYSSGNYQLSSDDPVAFGVLTAKYTHNVTSGSGQSQITTEVTDVYTYSAPSGSHGLTLETQDIRSQAETDALGAVAIGNGVSYYGYAVTLPGQPHIDLGDVITIEEPLGDVHNFIVLTASHNFNGALSTTFTAEIEDSDPSMSDGDMSGSVMDQVSVVSNTLGRQERLLADTIAANTARFNSIETNYAHITNGVIDNAQIGHADVVGLNTAYARIDAANINTSTTQTAWINQLMVQTGLLANSGTIYTLDAIQVNASNITAGTIDVERLIVTVNGEKYLIHIDPNTSQPVYEKLSGNIIQPQTIAADRIVANSITTQQITTQNLVGTNGWINLANGTFFYGNGADWATSTTGIVWDGTNLKIKGNVTITGGNVYTQTQVDNMVSDSTYMVAIEVVSINYQTPTCTLKVRVFKEGVELSDLTGLTFNWTKNASQTSLGTSQTLTTTDLESIYICTIS